MIHRSLVSWTLVIALWLCGAATGTDTLFAQTSKPKGPTSQPKSAKLDLGTFSVPLGKDWVKERPSSSMRAGQARLPAPSAGDQPAEMVVFHFPGGGSIAANVNRWKKQFAKPEGMTEADFARQSSTSVDTLPITILQVQGRYIGSRMPGRPAPKSVKALILGVLLSMILAAANAYLGLKVGLTVSASIPSWLAILRAVSG